MRSKQATLFETSERGTARMMMCIAAIAVLLAGSIPASQAGAETMVQSTTLPSGLTVVTEQRTESRVAGLSVAARAGSRNEDESTDSAVKMLERMYLQGTEARQ